MNLTLAKIAKAEARKNYCGDSTECAGNLAVIESYFGLQTPELRKSLHADWSGAFVYHCAVLSGISLPACYPDPRVGKSFASVSAWESYAHLPKIRLWNKGTEIEVGDLVFLTVPEGTPKLMGIILAIDGERLEIAVGNYHNHSAIIERTVSESVRGIVKLV